MSGPAAVHGRGATANPSGRFEKLSLELDDVRSSEAVLSAEASAKAEDPGSTEFFRDTSKSILTTNDSPDVGMEVSVNPYRGCEHGCIYCYARPYHEYLGLSAGVDFESRIFVKESAPQLLRAELMKKSWTPKVVAFSGVTDCYQPIERKLKLTRGCLEVMAEFRNPVAIITKSHLVTRDIDVLRVLAEHHAVQVMLSVTTLDDDLAN